jgi:hypothetical protein
MCELLTMSFTKLPLETVTDDFFSLPLCTLHIVAGPPQRWMADSMASEQFDHRGFCLNLALIRSGALDDLLEGTEGLENVTQDAPLTSLHRFVEADIVETLLNLTRNKSLPDDVRAHVSSVFLHFSTNTAGCAFLLSRGILSQLLDTFDTTTLDVTDNEALDTVMWIVHGVAREGGAYAEKLINLGIYHKCVEVLDRAAAHLSPDPREVADIVEVIAGVFANLALSVPPKTVGYFRAALPASARILAAFDPGLNSEAITSLLFCFSCAYSSETPAADWAFLHSSGFVTRTLEIADTGDVTGPAIQLLCAVAANSDGATKELFFDGVTLNKLALFAAKLASFHPCLHSSAFLLFLNDLAADSAALRLRFASLDLLAALPRRIAPYLRSSYLARGDDVWNVAVQATRLFSTLLADPCVSASVAPVLLRAGALDLLGATLAQARVYTLFDVDIPAVAACVAAFISLGSTARDDAYIHHNAALANPYLAAFCAAGAGDALALAVQQEPEAASSVLDLFNSVIGPIVGAEPTLEARGEVPPRFLALRPLAAHHTEDHGDHFDDSDTDDNGGDDDEDDGENDSDEDDADGGN